MVANARRPMPIAVGEDAAIDATSAPTLVERGARHHVIDHPMRQSFRRRDRLADDTQFEQFPPRDGAQHEGQDHHREDADARFGHAQPGVIGNDGDRRRRPSQNRRPARGR